MCLRPADVSMESCFIPHGQLDVICIYLFISAGSYNIMVCLFLCYNSNALYISRGDISIYVICYVWRFILVQKNIGRLVDLLALRVPLTLARDLIANPVPQRMHTPCTKDITHYQGLIFCNTKPSRWTHKMQWGHHQIIHNIHRRSQNRIT